MVKEEDQNSEEEHARYQSGVGKMMHMMRRSRPEISNAVRDLSRFMMQKTGPIHIATMKQAMKYCTDTPDQGLLLKPFQDTKWDGSRNFQFVITGFSDSSYASCPETRRSVMGYSVFLCGAPVSWKSKMEDIVTLSATEAELVAATACAQHMLFVMKLLEDMGLHVQKPMVLFVDNKGAKDLSNNWSVAGRTRHIDVRYYLLRDLKLAELIHVEWMPGEENCSDIFTKNLATPLFRKHTTKYCGSEA